MKAFLPDGKYRAVQLGSVDKLVIFNEADWKCLDETIKAVGEKNADFERYTRTLAQRGVELVIKDGKFEIPSVFLCDIAVAGSKKYVFFYNERYGQICVVNKKNFIPYLSPFCS